MSADICCDVCSRAFTGRRKPFCASCSQAALYANRLKQATNLLDRERHHAYAEAVVRPGNDGVLAALPEDADLDYISTAMMKHSLDSSRAEQEAVEFRINLVVEQAEELKKQIEDYKQRTTLQRERTQQRRTALAADKVELEKIMPRASEPVITSTKKVVQRLDKVRARTVDARHLLCHEAASAMNFHKRKDANGRTEYILGGIRIPDLRELNIRTQPRAKAPLVGGRTIAEPHDLVSESFDNLARLLNLCANYLSVRLPGEILLPHERFPRAAVMPEKSSYKYKDIEFPGLSASQSSSPTASRVIDRNQPRPRPLWLDRSLGQLCKEDPKAYTMYIEGVTTLAYNLAWLCRSQGIEEVNSFDAVCELGKNLMRLLSPQQSNKQPARPSLSRKGTGVTTRVTAASGRDVSNDSVHLGVFSHNSAQYNLASAGGSEIFKTWKIASQRLSDKLRAHLSTEISGAEWDLLEEREWDEEREDERPVLVGGSRRPDESRYAAGAMSVMTVAPHEGAEDDGPRTSAESEDAAKKKQSTGWMKVRDRSGGVG